MPSLLDEQVQYLDSSGSPIVGGFLYVGTVNTDAKSNTINIFSDRELTSALANPQTLDANGRATNKIWVAGKYSLLVEDISAVQKYAEQDNGETVATGVTSLSSISGGDTITGNASETITAYTDKEIYVFISASVNTGAVTLNIDSVGAKSVLKDHDVALSAGEIEAHQTVQVIYNGTDDTFELQNTKTSSQVLPQNHIAGMITSKSSADVLGITAGGARDATNAQDIVVASAFTKDVSASFVVGTGNGSLDTGTYTGSTLYAVWAILRSDTGVTDYLTSISFTAPTLPTSYDFKRLIGCFKTDSTPDIIAFDQVGDYFRYTGDVPQDINDTSVTLTFETGTISVPPNSLAYIYALGDSGSDGNLFVFIRPVGAADTATKNEGAFVFEISAGIVNYFGGATSVLADSSSQIQYAGDESTLTIRTFAFEMLTRSNPI